MISSKKYVDETLKANNLVANKALGQNFLVESKIAIEIVDKANIDKKTCVIEIGPGLGALTEHLVLRAGLVLAYEIDKNMVDILSKTFENVTNFKLTNIDFLKVDLEKLIKEIRQMGYEKIKLISNLPYYITSKLLNKILVNNLQIDETIAMMQKEVGQKIIKPDLKDMNMLTIFLQYQYEVSIVKYVGKNSYLPRPVIDSIVIKFKKVEPRFDVDFLTFVNVNKELFSTRRKTIYNNLKPLFNSTEELIECLEKLNIDKQLRVEQLDIKQIIDICNYINKKSVKN